MGAWRGIVRWHHDQPLTDDQNDALHGALPGYTTAERDADRGTLTARMTVEAGTARAAVEETLRAARAAHGAAFGTAGDPVDVRVLTDDEWLRELEHPAQVQLVGVAEAAEILGVSLQRVAQLADEHPAFPAPVASLKRGRIWTHGSIRAFADSDWRRRPGPKKTTPVPEA